MFFNCGISLNILHYVSFYAEEKQVFNPKNVVLSAPDVIPKNLKGVGTWRNNMEISWEVPSMPSDTLLKFFDVKYARAAFAVPLDAGGFPPCAQPLAYKDWNGPHLKYLVWWKRKDSREEWKNATTKWSKYYIYDADTFTPYDLKVQAVNDFGMGPESPIVTGFSGEDRK